MLIEALCDTLLLSCKLALRLMLRECDTLLLSCKLAERLMLKLCDLLWL